MLYKQILEKLIKNIKFINFKIFKMTVDIEIKEYVNQEMSKMYTTLDAVTREIRSGFSKLEGRMDVLEKGFNYRMDGLEKGLNYRMDGLEARMNGLSAEFRGLSAEFSGIRDRIAALFDLYHPLLLNYNELLAGFRNLETYVKKKLEDPKTGFTPEKPDNN